MDYHLDWLYASIFLAHGGDPQAVNDNGDRLISGNQEDIDWLVAFRAEGMWQVVMIEVKGVTGWSNKQALSKANRLRRIFGGKGNRWPGVRPHFVIASPTRPARLDCRAWPTWMKRKDGRPDWVSMEIPPGLIRPTRCDHQGRVAAQGGHWKVAERSLRGGSGRG